MSTFLIDFEWQRAVDPGSYCLVEVSLSGPVDYHLPGRRSRIDLPKARGQWGLAYHPLGIRVLAAKKGHRPSYVQQRRGTLERYRPLEKFPDLYALFLETRTADDALKFVQRFGPLTHDGLIERKGELVEGVLAHARSMNEYIRTLANSKYEHLLAEQLNPFAELEVTLDVDHRDNKPTLRVVPGTLLDALWLQAAQKISRGAVVRTCLHCGNLFEAGSGTLRRKDAKFCSEEHKIESHSLKRSKEK